MEILRESKLILSYAGLDKSNFVRIGGHCIPRIFVRFVIVAAIALCTILATMVCSQKYAEGMSAILLPIGTVLTYGSLFCQYSTFVSMVEPIARLFDYLQRTVNQSE